MIKQTNKILMIPILACILLLGGCESLAPADGWSTPRYPLPPLDDDEISGMNEEEVKQALKEIDRLVQGREPGGSENSKWEPIVFSIANENAALKLNTSIPIRRQKLLDRLKELKEDAGVPIDGES